MPKNYVSSNAKCPSKRSWDILSAVWVNARKAHYQREKRSSVKHCFHAYKLSSWTNRIRTRRNFPHSQSKYSLYIYIVHFLRVLHFSRAFPRWNPDVLNRKSTKFLYVGCWTFEYFPLRWNNSLDESFFLSNIEDVCFNQTLMLYIKIKSKYKNKFQNR